MKTYEFTEQVQVLGLDFIRTYQLAYARRPAFDDRWFRPYGGGRARTLSITEVR